VGAGRLVGRSARQRAASAKADVAQLAERVLGKDEVTSSILVIGSNLRSPMDSAGELRLASQASRSAVATEGGSYGWGKPGVVAANARRRTTEGRPQQRQWFSDATFITSSTSARIWRKRNLIVRNRM
jgi:hypothetical protein